MKKITWYYIDTFKEVINLIPLSNHENERMTFLRKSERDKKYVVIKQIKIIDNHNGNNNYSTILKEVYFLSTVKKNRYFVEIIDVLLSEDLEHIFLILRNEGVDFKVHIKKKFDYNKQIPGISRRIIFQVACGLKILHENGLCHNDIKPENIVTSPTGKAKLCDMGSVDKNEGIRNGGTEGYLSPQALLGKPRTKEDDMWSLGVVFLELLIKKDSLFFFEDSDYREVLKKLLEKFYDLKLKVPKRNDDILDDIIQYISDNNYNSFE